MQESRYFYFCVVFTYAERADTKSEYWTYVKDDFSADAFIVLNYLSILSSLIPVHIQNMKR